MMCMCVTEVHNSKTYFPSNFTVIVTSTFKSAVLYASTDIKALTSKQKFLNSSNKLTTIMDYTVSTNTIE